MSTVYNYTQGAMNKIGERLKINEKYETPSVIVGKVDNEIEVESFGDVI